MELHIVTKFQSPFHRARLHPVAHTQGAGIESATWNRNDSRPSDEFQGILYFAIGGPLAKIVAAVHDLVALDACVARQIGIASLTIRLASAPGCVEYSDANQLQVRVHIRPEIPTNLKHDGSLQAECKPMMHGAPMRACAVTERGLARRIRGRIPKGLRNQSIDCLHYSHALQQHSIAVLTEQYRVPWICTQSLDGMDETDVVRQQHG